MDNYYTVTEYAKMNGKDPAHIRRMLIYGRLVGEKIGKQWIIPKDAEYPIDNRIKNGDYRNWRKKSLRYSKNPDLFRVLHNMCRSLNDIYGDKLDKIVLYGSYARGEETDESDVDVAIILRTEVSEDVHEKVIDVVVDYELECEITISTVQIDKKQYSEWNKTLPYFINIEKEGIVLWK